MKYLVTPEGILKIIHIVSRFDKTLIIFSFFMNNGKFSFTQILGIICLGLLCNNFSKYVIISGWELFMHITNATFLIMCFILLLTNLFDVPSNVSTK